MQTCKLMGLLWAIVLMPFHLALGVDIVVGKVPFSIPVPSGFSVVSDYDKALIVGIEQYVLLLPDGEAEKLKKGLIPNHERRLFLSVPIDYVNSSFSVSDFEKLKKFTRDSGALADESRRQLEDQVGKVNQKARQETGVDLSLAADNTVILTPHSETKESIAFSVLGRFRATDSNSLPTVIENVTTATLLHLRGKLLWVYAAADTDGLEWSRQMSKTWAESIVATNPSDGFSDTGSSFGFDWIRILKAGVIWGVAGLVIALVRKKLRSRRPASSDPVQ